MNSNCNYSPETPNFGLNWWIFVPCVTLKFDRWPWKTRGHLFYATSSFMHHFVAIGEFKLALAIVRKRSIWVFLAFWPWNLMDDLEKNWTPFLSSVKLCASFHRHMWIQTGVTARKWLNWVLTCDLDLWSRPFAWTSRLSIVITVENLMEIHWQEHCEKGMTDGQTERSVLRAAWSQLKFIFDV